MAVDPVCKMLVDEKKAKYTSSYHGVVYYFCCSSCKEAFDRDPGKYVK